SAEQRTERASSTGVKKWLGLCSVALIVLLVGAGLLVALYRPRKPPVGDVAGGSPFVESAEGAGFLGPPRDMKGRPARGTTGDATLAIPLDRNAPPEALRIYLVAWRPGEAAPVSLRIVLNRRELYSAPVAAEGWERTFDLKGLDLGDEATLQIVSDT